MNYSRKEVLNITPNCLGGKYVFTNPNVPLGEGGSGIVYSANQLFDKNNSIHIQRAVKFFVFRDDLAEQFGIVSKANFKTEIINITRFNHQIILKVIDGDYYDIEYEGQRIRIPYTVTEYIEGKTLDHFFENDNCKGVISNEDEVFELFVQITQGLSYLHNNNFYHCDIAPKNIYVKVDENAKCFAVIGDLGAGRTLADDEGDDVLVVGTKAYMPEDIQAYKNQSVAYADFKMFQPRWDIYSLKQTIIEVIQQIKTNRCLDNTWHLERLKEKISKQDYCDVQQIQKDIERLRPLCNKVMNLDELSEASNEIRQVLIPLYPVYMSSRMLEISRHSMLLRLMDVSELLEGATTFPGANHTRYEHALGTYELMRKAILALLRNKQYAVFFDERTVLIGLISALIASVVHFPLSYAAIELNTQEKGHFKNFSNKEMFERLINKECRDGSLYSKIKHMFSEYDIQKEELEYVIFGKPQFCIENEKLEVMNKLLNSSVGVQVIDYLMRDSFHVGLKYRVDTDSLFSFMSVEDNKFCLKQYGITAAEQVIMNRYWMFKRIYWSEPNRANVALLKYMFYLVKNDDFAKNLVDNESYLSRNALKSFLVSCAEDNDKSKINDIFEFLNYKGQQRYRRILVAGSSDRRADKIWQEIVRKPYSEQELIRCKIEERVKRFLGMVRDEDYLNIPIILIDIPYEKPGNKLGGDVSVIRFSKEIESLSKASATVGRMHDSFNEQLAFLRVYLRPDVYEKYVQTRKKDGDDSIVKSLEENILEVLRYCTSNV